jgi:hypothetical protein
MRTFNEYKQSKEPEVTMNIPLLIRVLEYVREDVKSDVDLHKIVEKMISLSNKGTLKMDSYNKIIK